MPQSRRIATEKPRSQFQPWICRHRLRWDKAAFGIGFGLICLLNPVPTQAFEINACARLGSQRAKCEQYFGNGRLSGSSTSALAGGWLLVRTARPDDTSILSLIKSSDTAASDERFAGITIRCNRGTLDVIIVLLEGLPDRSDIKVVLGLGGTSQRYEARLQPDATVLLPASASEFLAVGPEETLSVNIASKDTKIDGTVQMAGARSALRALQALCPQ